LCRERLASLAWLARTRSIGLQFGAPTALQAIVNRSTLVSIIDNLVDNAIRYTPSGGRVEVRLQAIDGGIELQVLDDGPGIAPEHRERVFDRFYRIPGHVEPGSGLGLSIVRRVLVSQAASIRFIDGLSGRGLGVAVSWRVPLGATPTRP
jgi:signal transduction histidine kinase